jgi:hypothetical protein
VLSHLLSACCVVGVKCRFCVNNSTVDHGFPSDGVFLLLHLWVLPSRWLISLRRSPSSLSSLWMASWCEWLSLFANDGASRVLGLKILRVQGKESRTDHRSGLGRRPGPTGLGPSRPSSVALSLPWVLR